MHNQTKDRYFPLWDQTEKIIQCGVEVHKQLGSGFLEIVYKDALVHEFTVREIQFEREKMYKIAYKGKVLPHQFYADFVIFDQIILEIKAKEGIAPEDFAQTINYLKCSRCKVGLIINFGKSKIDIKRVLL
jgi:GxxExxY protein